MSSSDIEQSCIFQDHSFLIQDFVNLFLVFDSKWGVCSSCSSVSTNFLDQAVNFTSVSAYKEGNHTTILINYDK